MEVTKWYIVRGKVTVFLYMLRDIVAQWMACVLDRQTVVRIAVLHSVATMCGVSFPLEVEFEFTTWAWVQATAECRFGSGRFYLYLNVYIYVLFISKRVWGHYGELISVKIQ